MQTTLNPEAQAVSNGETEDLNTLDPVPQEDPGFASIPLGFERDGDEAPVIAAQDGPQAALDDFPFTAEGDGIEEEPTDKGLPVAFLTGAGGSSIDPADEASHIAEEPTDHGLPVAFLSAPQAILPEVWEDGFADLSL